jgi:hypothetical protein
MAAKEQFSSGDPESAYSDHSAQSERYFMQMLKVSGAYMKHTTPVLHWIMPHPNLLLATI